MPQPVYTFVLLHGTFDSQARWVEADSMVATTLSEAFNGSRFVAHRWSGRNSFGARQQAAEGLRSLLWSIATEVPESGVFRPPRCGYPRIQLASVDVRGAKNEQRIDRPRPS